MLARMKFWQRQVLVSVVCCCLVVVFILHSRTPQDSSSSRLRPAGSALGLKEEEKSVQTDIRKNDVDDAAGRKDLQSDEKVKIKTPGPVTFVNQTKSDCPNLLRPDNVEESETFQKVDGSMTLLEYSAFLDVDKNLVRVVGVGVAKTFVRMFCLMWYRPHQREDAQELKVVQGQLATLPEHHGRTYAAHYIECPLQDDAYPYAVSMATTDCRQDAPSGNDVRTPPTNVMPVLQPPSAASSSSSGGVGEGRGPGGGGESPLNFTVCVTALNFKYSRAYELVEMIELNRILGADLLTFYVNSVGDNVQQVLNWYEERGIVKLLDWNLPIEVDHWPPSKQAPQVHYFAQLASHNDCLNRYRGVSRFLVYQDLDEFVVPKKTSTWGELIPSLPRNQPQHDPPPCYIFRCVFFRKDWPPNSENFTGRALADRFMSVVLSTDKREPNLFDYNHRAKYMVDPRAVQTVGIHNVWKYRNSGQHCQNVKESDAMLHHYRNWENPGDSGRALRDTDIYRFRDQLLSRLQERWAELPQVPLDIPIAKYGQAFRMIEDQEKQYGRRRSRAGTFVVTNKAES